MKKLILTIIFLMSLVTGASAEYFSDIIVTGPNGAWIDARAYTSLSAAVTAASTNQRTIHIYSPQTCTTLTIGSNIALEFGRDGSITNTGTLTLQTKNITAPDRQIFTGTGQIDFASGTIVRSAWFQNFETSLALTTNDSIILIVSKPQTLTASFSVGNGVYLKWESPVNVLTIGAGVTLSNVHDVVAGNYQIFAGSGTCSFANYQRLNLLWFTNLRTILTWLNLTPATIIVEGTNTVDYTDTAPANINIEVMGNGVLSIGATKMLTIAGTLTNNGTISGFGSLNAVDGNIINNNIMSFTGTLTTDSDSQLLNNGSISDPSSITMAGTYSGIGYIDTAGAISMTGPVDIPAGTYVFRGAGTVTGLDVARPEWWGTDATILGKAITALQ